jgi:nucleoside-diphosphate-sugar epimerase
VLVAGAGGLVGRATIDHFQSEGGWDVVALSRRPPDPPTGVAHLSVDLTDAAACRAALGQLGGVTHIVYAALFEKPDLTDGWLEADQIAVNLAMLTNLLDALDPNNPGLRHIALLQGAKAYGVHLGQIPVPAHESWTVFRPQVVFGFGYPSMMNMVAAIGAYAAISRELGLPLIYPGSGTRVTEATDARLLARAIAWSGRNTAAANQIFNVTNGDVFTWENLWPTIARAFSMPLGLPHPMPLHRIMPGRAATWDKIVERYGLEPVTLERLVSGSWQFADFAFTRTHSTSSLLSTIKIRQAGFGDCIDTEESLAYWLAHWQARKLLPPAAG